MRKRGVVGLLAGALLVAAGRRRGGAARPRRAEALLRLADAERRARRPPRARRAPPRGRGARCAAGSARGGVLSIDALTGTPRQLLRTDGALSAPRAGDRTDIALDFVRANRAAIGLDASDLDGPRRAAPHDDRARADRRALPPALPRHPGVRQRPAGRDRPRGARALRGGLAAARPRRRLDRAGAQRRRGARRAAARRRRPAQPGGHVRPARRRGRSRQFAGGDFARLVLFGAAGGAKLAWHVTYQASSAAYYDAVVDASSGAILYRANLTKEIANAEVYENHPGDGGPVTVDLEAHGWLPTGATRLDGTYARQWADLDDDNVIDAGEATTRTVGGDFVYPFQQFQDGAPELPGRRAVRVGPRRPRRTRADNRLQNGVQAFYLVSYFARASRGRPRSASTPPRATSRRPTATRSTPRRSTARPRARTPTTSTTPTWRRRPTARRRGCRCSCSATPTRRLDFADVNGGDDSGVVWHEYGHGLSNRLITNADGSGAVNSAHAGAMGEAWGDWYASDLQVRDGLKTDTATAGEIDIGDYTELDDHALRSQAADCPVGRLRGDLPRHPDGRHGRIHARRLRQHLLRRPGGPRRRRALVRDAVGPAPGARQPTSAASDTAETLVTDGMRLSPPEPSMLDMRNAILSADQDELRRRQRGPDLGGLPRARDGLLRRRRGRLRHGADRGLLADAGRRRAHRHGDGRRHGRRGRAPDRGRDGRVRRPHVGRRAAHGASPAPTGATRSPACRSAPTGSSRSPRPPASTAPSRRTSWSPTAARRRATSPCGATGRPSAAGRRSWASATTRATTSAAAPTRRSTSRRARAGRRSTRTARARTTRTPATRR